MLDSWQTLPTWYSDHSSAKQMRLGTRGRVASLVLAGGVLSRVDLQGGKGKGNQGQR